MPVTLEECTTDQVERALPWRDIGEANVKVVLCLLRHEEPSKILVQPLLQAPEPECEALMPAVHGQSSTLCLCSSSDQQWNCHAQLGQARDQDRLR